MNNAQFLAYPPVVAAGNNANVIHYINNTQIANDGELVLMDAGLYLFSIYRIIVSANLKKPLYKILLTDKSRPD